MVPALIGLISFILGAAVVRLSMRRQLERVRRDAADSQNAFNVDLAKATAQCDLVRGQVTSLTNELSTAQEETKTERAAREQWRRDFAVLEEKLRAAEEQRKRLESDDTTRSTTFENLANRIFNERSKDSKDGINLLLAPLQQQLKDFRTRIDNVHSEDLRDRSSLISKIGSVQTASEQAGSKAELLARAIVGDSRIRGDWGEMTLEKILEDCGLRAGHEYVAQQTYTTEDGQRVRPDVVVNLPGNKSIVIDSKVSLVAYMQWHSATGGDEQRRDIEEHVAALRRHVRELSKKGYQDQIGSNTLEFVLMYVPIESAYLAALRHDAALYSNAFSSKVLIVGPTTLMAALQIIHNIWRYERQTKNAIEIGERAGALYDQFVLFTESFKELGGRLEQAQSAYTMTYKRLSQGNGNLVDRAHRLLELGAKAKRKLNPELISVSGAEGEAEVTLPSKDDLTAAGQGSIDLWPNAPSSGVPGQLDGVTEVPF